VFLSHFVRSGAVPHVSCRTVSRAAAQLPYEAMAREVGAPECPAGPDDASALMRAAAGARAALTGGAASAPSSSSSALEPLSRQAMSALQGSYRWGAGARDARVLVIHARARDCPSPLPSHTAARSCRTLATTRSPPP
jgi:hypothetical protein